MIQQFHISLKEYSRGFHLITDEIERILTDLPENGLLNIFIKHTSAGLMISENADPTVRSDFETIFNKLIPENSPEYRHTTEGPDDMPAHIKSSLTGHSINIPVSDHHLELGTWQGIYLCEFRNRGGRRKLVLTVYS
jgi:secondary thiamine-phosphate synthase enzyme